MLEKDGIHKKKGITRREFIGKSLKVGVGIAAASVASKFIGSSKYTPYSIFAGGGKKLEYTPKAGLAPGMIGG